MKVLLLAVLLAVLPAHLHADELPKGWDPRPNFTFGAGLGWGDVTRYILEPSGRRIWDEDDRDIRHFFARFELPADRKFTFLASYQRIQDDRSATRSLFTEEARTQAVEVALKFYPFGN